MQRTFRGVDEASTLCFPPDDWWTRRVNRDIIAALRCTFEVFEIDPQFLYSWQHQLGRESVGAGAGNRLVPVITAMYQAARARRLQQEEDDTLTLAADNPLHGLATSQQGNVQTLMDEGSLLATQLPDTRSVAIAGTMNPQSARPASRNLRSMFDISARGGVASDAIPRAEAQTTQITDSGMRSSGQEIDLQHANRDAWANRRAADRATLSVQQETGLTHGEPRKQSAFNANEPSMHQPELHVRTSRPAQPPNGGNAEDEQTSTPTGSTISRTQSSPAPLSVMDLNKMRDSQRRAIKDKNLKFTMNTYLNDFILNAKKALNKATHLEKDDKAEQLTAMLGDDVKAALIDRSEIQHPEDPEEIFRVLRAEFAPKMAELHIALQDHKMFESEEATTYLNRVRSTFMMNQAPFPTTHASMLPIYMNGTTSMIQFFQTQHNMRLEDMRKIGAETEDYPLRWSDIQDWARRFDMQRSMMKKIKSTRREPTRETRDLAQNDTNMHKTRSGKVGNVSAMEPDSRSPGRGRSDKYEPGHQQQTHRSRSRNSNGSYISNKSDHYSKSPGRSKSADAGGRSDRAGSTPFKRGYHKPQFHRSGSGNHDANVSNIFVADMNWIQVNLLGTTQMHDVTPEVDSKPIVISTLPAHVIHHSQVMAEVNAVNRRPTNPEPISQDDLDEGAEPLNLPEAMRRGLRQVQNLPVNNPYAKVLGAHFYLTFRQLAGLCLDEEFSSICKRLLEVSLQREGRQQSATNARAAADIFGLLMSELPHSRLSSDMTARISPDLQVATCAPRQGEKLDIQIVRMSEVQAYLDDQQQESRKLRLDSGASVSCISAAAFQRDKAHLLKHGKVHRLLTPMTLSGFASAHTKVNMILTSPMLIIGNAACRHSFLVVPGLVCDYMLGQDFMLSYDMHIRLQDRKARMGVPEDEWIGASEDYLGFQKIDIAFGWSRALLAVEPS